MGDRDCRRGKRRVKATYRKWKSGLEERINYVEKKKKLREICREKEKRRKELLEKEVKNLRTKTQIWKCINKERKRRKHYDEEIKIEEEVWNGRGIS